jgi:hypothetical protein
LINKESHTRELLRRWLDGRITAREEAELDRTAQDDPWLAEALEAYREQAAGEHKEAITQLRSRLRPAAKSGRVLPMVWRVAAVGLVVLAAAWWIWQSSSSGFEQATGLAMDSATESIEKITEAPAPPTADVVDAKTKVEQESPAVVAPNTPTTEATSKRRSSPSVSTEEGRKKEVLASSSHPSAVTEDVLAASKDMHANTTTETGYAVEADALAEEAPPSAVSPTDFEEAAQMSMEDTVAPSWDDFPVQPARTVDPAMISNMGRIEASPGYFLVEGIVVDDQGYPLIGANILDMGSNRGVVTGLDGQFQFAIDSTSKQLQISYTGFETETVAVSPQQKQLEVVLDEATDNLSEVVVTGMGVSREDGTTSAVPVGGHRAFRRYIRAQTPPNTPTGAVTLRFMVQADGSVTDIVVLEAATVELGQLATELLSDGPKWELTNGVGPLDVEYKLRFK